MKSSHDNAPLEMLYTGNAPSWQNPSLTNINKLPPTPRCTRMQTRRVH